MGDTISDDLGCKVTELERIYSTGFNAIRAVLMRKYRYPIDQAEDLVQDAFVRGLQAIETYNGEASMFTWMTKIACNLAVTDLRRRRNYIDKVGCMKREDMDLTINRTTESPDRRIAIIQYTEACQAALPPSYRATWALRCDEYHYDEIADAVGCRKGTVMSRLSRGRAMMRQKGIDVHAYF